MDPKLAALVTKVNKKYGAGAVIQGSEIDWSRVPRITSGSLGLDVILGGGWPVNQWAEIIGHESSGKTAIVLKTIAANQAADPNWTAWWLASEPWDPAYADMLGVDRSRVVLHDTNVMEDGYQAILDVAKAQVVDCVVIDSLPALVPSREDTNEAGETAPGLQAWMTNQFFRKQGSATRRSLTTLERPITGFLINQWREQIGVMHGDPRITPGGKGKNFAAVIRLDVRRGDWIKPDGGEPAGQTIHARTLKNKSHRPHRVCNFDFYFTDCEGHRAGSYDRLKEVANVGVIYGVILRSGSWFSYGDRKWQGLAAMTEEMAADPVLAEEVAQEVLSIVRRGERAAPKPPKEDPAPKRKPPKQSGAAA